MVVDMKDLSQVERELYRAKYVLKDDNSYRRLGENMLLFYFGMEDELIRTKTSGFKICFIYPAIVEYIALHGNLPTIFDRIVNKTPFFEELYYYRVDNNPDNRTLIEEFMMHENIYVSQLTLFNVINIALKMPGTKYYNSIVNDMVSRLINDYDIIKKEKDGPRLLLPHQLASSFTNTLLESFNFGTSLERKDYKDLRYILLRYQRKKIEGLTFPYENAYKKLVYDFYDEQETYDIFIDDMYTDISSTLENAGYEFDFIEDLVDSSSEIIGDLKMQCGFEDLISDIEFLVSLLSIRPYCYMGSGSDSN